MKNDKTEIEITPTPHLENSKFMISTPDVTMFVNEIEKSHNFLYCYMNNTDGYVISIRLRNLKPINKRTKQIIKLAKEWC